MSSLRRNSAWHVLVAIFLLGFATWVLSLHSPKSNLAIWLEGHWRYVGAQIAVVYLLVRLFRPLLPLASCPAPPEDDVSVPNEPLWGDGVPALTDLPAGSMEWSRAKAIHDGASLSVPDAVYRIIEFNDWCSELSIIPSELAWLDSDEQFDVWSRKARMLRMSAYRVGNAGLSKSETYNEVREKFISDNPGFSRSTYERAISYGYQQAR